MLLFQYKETKKLGWGSNRDVLAMLLCLAVRSDSPIIRAPVELLKRKTCLECWEL